MINEAIKALREARGMSQEQLAEKVGCSFPMIVEFEYEPCDWLKLSELQNIAKALDVAPSEILKLAENMEKAKKGGGETWFAESIVIEAFEEWSVENANGN